MRASHPSAYPNNRPLLNSSSAPFFPLIQLSHFSSFCCTYTISRRPTLTVGLFGFLFRIIARNISSKTPVLHWTPHHHFAPPAPQPGVTHHPSPERAHLPTQCTELHHGTFWCWRDGLPMQSERKIFLTWPNRYPISRRILALATSGNLRPETPAKLLRKKLT